jgi:hypothetical protein
MTRCSVPQIGQSMVARPMLTPILSRVASEADERATTDALGEGVGGVGRCSRHVKAIGRSPRCSTFRGSEVVPGSRLF